MMLNKLVGPSFNMLNGEEGLGARITLLHCSLVFTIYFPSSSKGFFIVDCFQYHARGR